jgi:hypothetical protein
MTNQWQVSGFFDDPSRRLKEFLARRRQPGPAVRALEKSSADLLLKVAHSSAQR